jgi:hypothetical protein
MYVTVNETLVFLSAALCYPERNEGSQFSERNEKSHLLYYNPFSNTQHKYKPVILM